MNLKGNNRQGIVLQNRDLHLLQELAVMRVIDREQAKVIAGFHWTSQVNLRLLRLTQAGLLRRFFLGTTGAGQKALYTLSAKGAQTAGVPLRGLHRRKDESVAADFSITHQLAVNWIYCALKYVAIPIPHVRFKRWVAFFEPLTKGVPLIPDGYVELETPQGTFSAFLEVDLGSERRLIWKAKVQRYVQLALSGEYERLFGQSRFRVLILAPTKRRVDSIRKTVAETTDRVFWFTTLDAADRDGLFASIWSRSQGETKEHLIAPTA